MSTLSADNLKLDEASQVRGPLWVPRSADQNVGLQKEISAFLEQEQGKARMQSSIHNFTSMCWDKCVPLKDFLRYAAEKPCRVGASR